MSKIISPLQSGAFLLRQLSEKRLIPKDLTSHQRILCIQYMWREQKWTQSEMGEILGVHQTAVSRVVIRLRQHSAHMLDAIDQRAVAVELINCAEAVCSKLMRAGKEDAAWKVRKELVESLQTLGFISKEPIRLEGSLKLSLREVIELANTTGKAADIAADDSGKNGSQEISPSHQNGNGSISNRSHPSLEGP